MMICDYYWATAILQIQPYLKLSIKMKKIPFINDNIKVIFVKKYKVFICLKKYINSLP